MADSIANKLGVRAHDALSGVTLPGLIGAMNPAAGVVAKAPGAMADFFHGLVTGHAIGQGAAVPVGKAKIGSVTVDLPPAQGMATKDGAPAYSQSFLDKQPNWVQQAALAAAATAGGGQAAASSKKASNPMDEAMARFAQSDGGISLNEMAQLSQSMADTSPLRTQPKDPSSKDKAGTSIMDMADAIYAGKLQQAQALKAKDPAAAIQLQGEAVKERMDALKAILGANPVDLQTAAAMGGTAE